MKILHLTDLHLTPATRAKVHSLESVWCEAEKVLPERLAQFDFVVITGDLTQKATKQEYDELGAFLDQLLNRVRDKDRRRIIMVPGNHDVDWMTPLGTPIPITELARDEGLRKEFKDALRSQATSELRWKLNERAELTLSRIDPHQYAQRFMNCDEFLRAFYAKCASPPVEDRRFELALVDAAKHWSAHFFEGEKVVFFGFNSCHRNDEVCDGAAVSPEAIEAVKKHANSHAPLKKGWTRVVLWHHGVRSERGNPDLLTPPNLEQIASLQPALGMHGHTHEDGVAELRDALKSPFPVVGAGSFIIHAEQRPEGIPNGFSVVELTRSLIRWERYHRHRSGKWLPPAASDEVIFSRLPICRRLSERPTVLPRVGVHRRSAKVDDDGIASVTVSMSDVHVHGQLPLAHVHTPFNNFEHDRLATLDRGQGQVSKHERDNGDVWLNLDGDAGSVSHHRKVEWSYRIANGFALSRRDLDARDERIHGSNILPGYDFFAHIVQLQTDTLKLELELPSLCIEQVEVRAERRGGGDNASWVLDELETSTIESDFTGVVTNRVSISVSQPVLDCRYVVLYKVMASEKDRTARNHAQFWVNEVRERCRVHANGRQTRRPFAAATRNAIATALGESDQTVLSWIAYLWDPDEKHLVATFGDGPIGDWSAHFAYGQGLVGHSFRVQGPALYHERANGQHRERHALLLLEPERARKQGIWLRSHKWIDCVPILNGRDNTAVGVVSFYASTSDSDGGPSAELRRIALAAVTGNKRLVAVRLETLIREISVAFWTTVEFLKIGDAKQLALSSATASGSQRTATPLRRAPRIPAQGVVTLNCNEHGPMPLRRINRSVDGLGLIGDPCECAQRDAQFEFDMDATPCIAVVRRRETDGSLGLTWSTLDTQSRQPSQR